jgi:hypothetical protein
MSKKRDVLMADEQTVSITIGGETWALKPLRGLKAMKLMPKVISIGSEIFYAAIEAGIPLDKMFLDGAELRFDAGAGLRAFKFIADALTKRWDDLSADIIPFLLCRDYGWLSEHGEVKEILNGLWTAVKYHLPSIIGDDAVSALKKSVTAAPESPVAADE